MDKRINILVALAIVSYMTSTVSSYGGYQFKYERQHYMNERSQRGTDDSDWGYWRDNHNKPYGTYPGYGGNRKEFYGPTHHHGYESGASSGEDNEQWNKYPSWGNNHEWGYPNNNNMPWGPPSNMPSPGNSFEQPPRFPSLPWQNQPPMFPPAPPRPMPNAVVDGTTETPRQVLLCLQSCPVTSEHNPVCGSNNVTYNNPSRLDCAISCGVDVTLNRTTSCLIPPAPPSTENNTPAPEPPTRFTTIDANPPGGSTNTPILATDPTPDKTPATIPADVLASVFAPAEENLGIDIRSKNATSA